MTKSNKTALHPEDVKLLLALAKHLGWTEIVSTGGAFLGRPPEGEYCVRGQCMIPDWINSYDACCTLADRYNCFPEKAHIQHEYHWATTQHKRSITRGQAFRLAIMRNVMLAIKHSNLLQLERGQGITDGDDNQD